MINKLLFFNSIINLILIMVTRKIKSIVIITDCVDVAANEIIAQLKRLIKRKDLIEPVVPVAPLSLINTSFIIRLMAELYEDAIFYVVVNPIKEEPERIIGRTKKRNIIFVGRNTGVFSWLVDDLGLKELYEIPYKEFVPFGGKYIYPFWIAKIIKSKKLSDLKIKKLPFNRLRRLEIPEGTVVHIDNFGLAKIKMDPKIFEKMGLKEGDLVDIYVNGRKLVTAVYRKRMMSEEDGRWVVYPGSSLGGLPEIGRVRCLGSAQELGIKIGDLVEFRKHLEV